MRDIDWIYVDDVVEAFLTAASSEPALGHAIDIGSGTSISIRETVHLLTSLVGSSVQPEFGALPRCQQDTSRISDTTAAKELLGRSASTELADRLTTTIRWYRDHLHGCRPHKLRKKGIR